MWLPWPYGIGALRGGLPILVLCSLHRGTAQDCGPSPQALARLRCSRVLPSTMGRFEARVLSSLGFRGSSGLQVPRHCPLPLAPPLPQVRSDVSQFCPH